MTDTKNIENILGYAFGNKALLERAFVHSSYANEHGVESYDRLEFLGDGVLGMVIAERLYYTREDAGEMTEKRARIVSTAPLEDVTEDLGLDGYIVYGEGERKFRHARRKVLADVYEAIVGAIYLDGGFDDAKAFVLRSLGDRIDKIIDSRDSGNSKGDFQEYCQAHGITEVRYVQTDVSGSRHEPIYRMAVEINGRIYAEGEGARKKDAEREAARKALEILITEAQ